jgi:hypothetical protein
LFSYYLSGYNLEDWANNHNYHDHTQGFAVAQRLVTALSVGMIGFSPRAVHARFVVDKGKCDIFLQIRRFNFVSIIPQFLPLVVESIIP